MNKSFSIIIPTKNEEECLPRLLQSIKNQSIQPNEIIVADADSTDMTKAIAKDFGAIVTKGGLPGVGRNNGAKLATGDILLFLDADTVLKPGFLREFLRKFIKSNSKIVNPSFYSSNKKPINLIMIWFMNLSYYLIQRFSPHVQGSCLMVEKKVFDKVSGFDESYIINEENDLVRRIAKNYKFSYFRSPKIGLNMRRFDKFGWIKLMRDYIVADFKTRFDNGFKKDEFDYWKDESYKK